MASEKYRTEDLPNLYNSQICRLCGEENSNGSNLYVSDETDISFLINNYMPLKISDDGQYPRWICPGCHLQVESTVEFFDLVISGQNNLRVLLNEQLLKTQIKGILDKTNNANNELYADDHDLKYRMNGTEKPKRKRGRPPKPPPDVLRAQELEAQSKKDEELKKSQERKELNELAAETSCEGRRRKRQIKIPLRFQEVVQGKELERIYVEKGVIDKSETVTDDGYAHVNDLTDFNDEIIGHLQDTDGSNIAELILNNDKSAAGYRKAKYLSKKRKIKFICDICHREFLHEFRFLAHRATHHNVRYECTQCIEHFVDRLQLCDHQKETGHVGEGIIESLEECDARLMPMDFADKSIVVEGDHTDNVFPEINECLDDINNIEEAAKVLYGLQNMDKIDHNHQPYAPSSLSTSDELLSSVNNYGIRVKNEATTFSNGNKENRCARLTGNEVKIKENNYQIIDIEKDKRPKRYDCEICNKSFANAMLLQTHFELIHKYDEDGLLKSTNLNNNRKINATTTTSTKIKPEDNPLRFPCNKCERVFRSASSVLYHKDSEHSSGRRFVCNKCGKCFKHKQLLQRHQLVHSDDRPFPCNICGALFKTKPNLLNHLPKHTGEKKHICHVCQQTFAHKTSLKLHYRWHAGKKPFACKICDKKFTQNGNLQEHMRIHTGERPYDCRYCDKKFKTSSQCRIHLKRHSNLKPYDCAICSKRFFHYDIYRTHLRRHNNEKPFECSYCPKSFSEQWALRKHIRIHTGEKPYNCPVCNKAFADCSNLTKHKKTHENDADSTKPEEEEEEEFRLKPNDQDLNVAEILSADSSGATAAIDNGEMAIERDDETRWGLLDRNEEDNQIIYVTYQDPTDPTGNKTLQVVHQLNSNGLNLMSESQSEFEQQLSSIEYITNDVINDYSLNNMDNSMDATSKIEHGDLLMHVTNDKVMVALDNNEHDSQNDIHLQSSHIDDNNVYCDENGQAIEMITSDGRKLRIITGYPEPLDLSADYIIS